VKNSIRRGSPEWAQFADCLEAGPERNSAWTILAQTLEKKTFPGGFEEVLAVFSYLVDSDESLLEAILGDAS